MADDVFVPSSSSMKMLTYFIHFTCMLTKKLLNLKCAYERKNNLFWAQLLLSKFNCQHTCKGIYLVYLNAYVFQLRCHTRFRTRFHTRPGVHFRERHLLTIMAKMQRRNISCPCTADNSSRLQLLVDSIIFAAVLKHLYIKNSITVLFFSQ